MTKYREILRLKSLGYSERNIALCCSVSRNTVAKVRKSKRIGNNLASCTRSDRQGSFENVISERKNYCKKKDARL